MGEAGKAMDPELVTPVVVYLAHRSCDRTAHIYSVGAGKVSRVFIGVTKGIENTSLTAESVAASIDEIDDSATFTIRGGPDRGLSVRSPGTGAYGARRTIADPPADRRCATPLPAPTPPARTRGHAPIPTTPREVAW